jgi:hypothetical protein
MADKNFKGGPGGRLKREEEKNTLYVNNPNDPRLRMYQDSLQAAIPAILGNKEIQYMNTLPMDKRRKYYESEFLKNPKFEAPISSFEAVNRLADANKKQYLTTKRNPFVKTKIEPPAGYSYILGSNPNRLSAIVEYGMYENLPKRKVVFKREEIEPIPTRQTPTPTFIPEKIVAPVMRPVPMEEPVVEKPIETQKREVFYRNNKGQRKIPKAVMPSRQGGWGNQPLLMKLFPKLYER